MQPQSTANEHIAVMAGVAALPRRNGELVFATPWEGRIFGVAVALSDRQLFPWDDFRDQLIAEIGAPEADPSPTSYYEKWLAALEKLLVETGHLTPTELDRRTEEYRSGARDDHDDHDHNHDDHD